jgi:hypothetical protein
MEEYGASNQTLMMKEGTVFSYALCIVSEPEVVR